MSDIEDDNKTTPEPKQELGATKATNIKLQQFWSDNPHTWFNMAELQLRLAGVTGDKSKCLQVLAALSPQACEVISDILGQDQLTYGKLKTTLLTRLAPSDESKLESLLSTQDMGDRRPSEVLRRIKHLAGTQFPNNTLKSLWIRQMPEIIRIALVAQPEVRQLDDLAATADKLYEAMSATRSLSAVTRQSRPVGRTDSGRGGNRPPSASPSNATSIEDRLARIEARLNGLFTDNRGRSRGRFSSRPGYRGRTRSPSNNNRRSDICWYHDRYGTAARKCTKPCSYGQSASTSIMEVDNSKNL